MTFTKLFCLAFVVCGTKKKKNSTGPVDLKPARVLFIYLFIYFIKSRLFTLRQFI